MTGSMSAGLSILSLTLDSHTDYLRNYERVILLGGDSLSSPYLLNSKGLNQDCRREVKG